jgi:hypothetical protein
MFIWNSNRIIDNLSLCASQLDIGRFGLKMRGGELKGAWVVEDNAPELT